MPSDNQDLFSAARRWGTANRPGAMLRRVILLFDDDTTDDPGFSGKPGPAPQQAPSVARETTGDDEITAPERDILALFKRTGRRATADEIESMLSKADALHGTSTIKTAIRLLRARKLINQGSDVHGSGYGLSDWK